jgi:RHS repeat-associated protein
MFMVQIWKSCRYVVLGLVAMSIPGVWAQTSEVEGEKDAYRRPWVPPKPVKSRELSRVKPIKVAGPNLDLKTLSKDGGLEELRAKGALQVPLTLSPQSKEKGVAGGKFRDVLLRANNNGGALNEKTRHILKEYVQANKEAGENAALCYEIAKQSRLHGDFVTQGEYLQKAWEMSKGWEGEQERRFADAILADYFTYLTQLGRKQEVRALLTETEGRELTGTAVEAASKAKENLWFLENRAEQNIFCGFTAANDVCVPLGFAPIHPDVHDEEEKAIFIRDGLSLYELKAHSHEGGGDLEVVKRVKGNAIPFPSVIHLNFNHYSAITESDQGRYRLKDDHLKYDGWIEPEVLNEQASGYFLVSGKTKLPKGFEVVGDEEAKKVFGRHCVHAREPEGDTGIANPAPPCQNGKTCPPQKSAPPPKPPAMATYQFSMLNPGLMLQDIPISHSPPYGPKVYFQVSYNQRSTVIDDAPQHANLGPRWTYATCEYIQIDSVGTPPAAVKYVDSHGQFFRYSWNTSAGAYASTYANQPKLSYVNSSSGGPGFVLRYENGFESHFMQGNSSSATRYYLTAVVDAQGNALSLAYDSNMRLVTVTDALGQVTTLSYTPESGDGVPSDTLKIRKITDPFGRDAKLYYDTSGRLKKIVDPIGVFSEFNYAAGDFINQLTTSYGTTTFNWGDLPGINSEPGRFIEATDPYGDKERAEANDLTEYPTGGVDPHPAPTSVTVNGQAVSFLPKTDLLFYRNTFYWDKKMWKMAPGDYSKARIINWLAIDGDKITNVEGSVKNPLEGRVWFNYPGQTSAHAPGTIKSPSKIVRAVENGSGGLTWTITQLFYDNNTGRLVQSIDPEGRKMRWNYASNGEDLLSIEFDDGGTWKTLQSFANYIDHQPGQITDASGLVTSITYNTVGQASQVTTTRGANAQAIKYIYDEDLDGDEDDKGYLLRVEATSPTDPNAFVTLSSYTYDSVGRVRTAADESGYSVTYDYDDFDRVTVVTHPDGTTNQYVYDKFDLVASKNRAGQWERTFYDKLRKPIAIVDPAGRTTQLEWCKCGDLQKLIDPLGRVTHWKRDEQGRVIEKIYPDGSKGLLAYQPMSGRISSVTEPADVATSTPTVTFKYSLSGQKILSDYSSATVGDVSYTYADPLARVTSSTDAIGTTSYTYNPIDGTSPGAGRLASTNGPIADDSIFLSYDWLNRAFKTELKADSSGTVLWTEEADIDSLGRVIEVNNGLGTFIYVYDGNSGRVLSKQSPNGLETFFEYYPQSALNAKAYRLKKITNEVSSALVSYFEYDYDIVGRITNWEKMQNGVQTTSTFQYNLVSELTEAITRDASSAVLSNKAWRYDAASNRVTEFTETATVPSYFNNLNQLTRVGGGGKTLIEGLIDEPGTVKVNGVEAEMISIPGTSEWSFSKEVDVTEGSNTVSIVATDESENSTSESYEYNVASLASTLSYDGNGNLLYDGQRQYTWDAKNQLLSVENGGVVTSWVYDGQGRRVEESIDGILQRRWIWIGLQIAQERDASGSVVSSFYSSGMSTPMESLVYTVDHLGSVREAIDASSITQVVYDYDSWGIRTKLSGSIELSTGYTGHFQYISLGLIAAPYRFYDPEYGRWISRDPIGEEGGINLYGYVSNLPIDFTDPLGLMPDEEVIMQTVYDTSTRKPLGKYRKYAVSSDVFVEQTRGLTLRQVETQTGASKYSEGGPVSTIRYVKDPANPENIIDMRHFIVIGQRSETYGLLAEIAQIVFSPESAFDQQDFYSNQLGAYFFANVYDPDKELSEQLDKFFKSRGSLCD